MSSASTSITSTASTGASFYQTRTRASLAAQRAEERYSRSRPQGSLFYGMRFQWLEFVHHLLSTDAVFRADVVPVVRSGALNRNLHRGAYKNYGIEHIVHDVRACLGMSISERPAGVDKYAYCENDFYGAHTVIAGVTIRNPADCHDYALPAPGPAPVLGTSVLGAFDVEYDCETDDYYVGHRVDMYDRDLQLLPVRIERSCLGTTERALLGVFGAETLPEFYFF
jgi:hypothetical protein